MLKTGIDVSYHNGEIDWKRAQESGIEFAIIRGGFGKNNIDKQAHNNFIKCNSIGLPVGMYWFSYAYTENMARCEARYAVALAKMHVLEYPIYFDFEYDSADYMYRKAGVHATKHLVTELAKAFCDEVEKAGYYAGIYANNDYVKNYYESTIFERYDLWYASYVSNPLIDAHLWQFTSTGTVPGVVGNVDMNRARIDFPEIIKRKCLNGFNKTVSRET